MNMVRFQLAFSILIMSLLPTATHAAPPPLSCEMESLLNGLAAMQRDQGVSRKDNALIKNPDDELTKQEIKEILDRVYLHQKSKTPDQIKDAVYAACKKRSR